MPRACQYLWNPGEDAGSPGAGIRDRCKPSNVDRYRELNSGPLQEQETLLNTESSHQTHTQDYLIPKTWFLDDTEYKLFAQGFMNNERSSETSIC